MRTPPAARPPLSRPAPLSMDAAREAYREAERRPDRSWWDIGATATFGQVDVDLRYYDTDLDYAECGFSPNCSSAVVGSISWNPWKG